VVVAALQVQAEQLQTAAALARQLAQVQMPQLTQVVAAEAVAEPHPATVAQVAKV
jgi:hypothetical protein